MGAVSRFLFTAGGNPAGEKNAQGAGASVYDAGSMYRICDLSGRYPVSGSLPDRKDVCRNVLRAGGHEFFIAADQPSAGAYSGCLRIRILPGQAPGRPAAETVCGCCGSVLQTGFLCLHDRTSCIVYAESVWRYLQSVYLLPVLEKE